MTKLIREASKGCNMSDVNMTTPHNKVVFDSFAESYWPPMGKFGEGRRKEFGIHN